MNLRRLLNLALLGLVILVAGILSYRYKGESGLIGFGAGTALGLSLCGLSHLFWRSARKAEGYAIQKIVMGGLLVTFTTVIISVLFVRWFWPEILQSFALTTLGIYLAHRFFDAISQGMNPGLVAAAGQVAGPEVRESPGGRDGR